MYSLKETLLLLKSKVDEAFLKQLPQEFYDKEILPLLIALRGINRREKQELEAKCQTTKQLYYNLITLQQVCECLAFEGSCLGFDVENIKQGMDPEDTPRNGLDFATRMQLLDVEEARRRELQMMLSDLTEQTKEVELSCSKRTDQLNQVKPYVMQLLEKVKFDENKL